MRVADPAMVDDATLTKDSSLTSSSSDTVSQDPLSPVGSVEEFLVEVEEVGEDEPLDEEPSALSVSTVGDAVAPKPRRAFRVTDTRKSRCHLSRAVFVFTESTPTANTSFATSCLPDSSSSGVGTMSQSGTTTTTRSTNTVERLISLQELAVKRSQRRQQAREAARRLREYNAAWAELVASQRCRTSERAAATTTATDGARPQLSGQVESNTSKATPEYEEDEEEMRVVAVPLTNEALESHRERVEAPSFELPSDLLARMGRLNDTATTAKSDAKATEEVGSEEQRSLTDASDTSGHSSNSGALVIDDEGIPVEAVALPVNYGTLLRYSEKEATKPSSSAAATAAATQVGPTSALGRDTATSSNGSHMEEDSLQRIPRGKYALGSRGYVEHVMFAQRRQQECALFTLLTEAHRQARAAHLRLSQLYYYYILPILGQYQEPAEVEGLANSLLECGTGSLRVFHSNFCKTVSVGGVYDYTHGTYVPANLVQVLPVDYQLAQYRFENPWRELFHEIKSFLGMQAREDVSVATPSIRSCSEDGEKDVKGRGRLLVPGRGTVCVAATVLHSMEIFERQRHIQMAIRDAEDWLAWYYYYFTPKMQTATSLEARRAVVLSLLRIPSSAAERAEGGGRTAPPPHPLEREYLPLLWSRACEAAKREEVLTYRRALKLEVMEKATAALQQRLSANRKPPVEAAASAASDELFALKTALNDCIISNNSDDVRGQTELNTPATTATMVVETNVCFPASERTSSIIEVDAEVLRCEEVEPPHETPSATARLPTLFAEDYQPASHLRSLHTSSTVARVDVYTGRIKNGFVMADDDDDEIEEENVVIDSYQTVNVGCFGLSFFSFFD